MLSIPPPICWGANMCFELRGGSAIRKFTTVWAEEKYVGARVGYHQVELSEEEEEAPNPQHY